MNLHPLILALGYGTGAALSALIATEAAGFADVGFQGWLGTAAAAFFAFWGKLTHPTKAVATRSDTERAEGPHL